MNKLIIVLILCIILVVGLICNKKYNESFQNNNPSSGKPSAPASAPASASAPAPAIAMHRTISTDHHQPELHIKYKDVILIVLHPILIIVMNVFLDMNCPVVTMLVAVDYLDVISHQMLIIIHVVNMVL